MSFDALERFFLADRPITYKGDQDPLLSNFNLECKYCKEKLTDYRLAINHIQSYHKEAYQYWRSKVNQ
jgi:hypothetical protein